MNIFCTLNRQKYTRRGIWLYGEGERIRSGLMPAWAQMVAEQDVPTCTSAHKLVCTLSHTYTYICNNYMCMNACVNSGLHISTPTDSCWLAKSKAHCIAQEVTESTLIGHLGGCQKASIRLWNICCCFVCFNSNVGHSEIYVKSWLWLKEISKIKQDN